MEISSTLKSAPRVFVMFLVGSLLLEAGGTIRKAHAEYWTANSAGSVCASQLQGVPFDDGLVAADAYYECMFSGAVYEDRKCGFETVNTINVPRCRSIIPGYNYVFTQASLHCEAGDSRTTDLKCKPPSQVSSCPVRIGNPVEAATGRKVQITTDWTSGGTAPLTFTREYSSQFSVFADRDINYAYADERIDFGYSRLGRGWRSNFDSRARYQLAAGIVHPELAQTNDILHFVMPNSLQYSLKKTSTGAWQPVAVTAGSTAGTNVWVDRTDVDITIAVDAIGVTLRFINGTKYTYNNDGLLIRITFPNGYSQYLEYADAFNTRVVDSFGRAIAFEYEDNVYRPGFLKSATMPDGTNISFGYVSRLAIGSSGVDHPYYALETVIYPDNTPTVDTDNPRLTYGYLNSTKFPYALASITDERGIQHGAWTYDAEGRATSSSHDGGADLTTLTYDDVNDTVTVTNALGRSTVYSFSTTQQVFKRLTAVDGVATTNCAASNTTYLSDSNGYRSQATDAEGRITKWVRNAHGLPTSTTEGFGTAEARTTTTTWDADRPLPNQIVQPGLTTDIVYDAGGLVTSTTQTDTSTTSVPYSTNGQTRTTGFAYTTFTPPTPPAVGPIGTGLSDVSLTIVNGDAESGPITGAITGWTNQQKSLAIRNGGASCSTSNRCFWGKSSTPMQAYQDVAIPASNYSEVDAGLRAATISWRQDSTSGDEPNYGTVQLEFRDGSGNILDLQGHGHSPVVGWHQRENTTPVPPLTRTIRVRMAMIRQTGALYNAAYIDDIALKLVADGDAAADPFLTVANGAALTGNTTGWSVTGSIPTSTAAPCQFMACFNGGATGVDTLSQDIVVPSSRTTSEVDLLARGVELQWMARIKDDPCKPR